MSEGFSSCSHESVIQHQHTPYCSRPHGGRSRCCIFTAGIRGRGVRCLPSYTKGMVPAAPTKRTLPHAGVRLILFDRQPVQQPPADFSSRTRAAGMLRKYRICFRHESPEGEVLVGGQPKRIRNALITTLDSPPRRWTPRTRRHRLLSLVSPPVSGADDIAGSCSERGGREARSLPRPCHVAHGGRAGGTRSLSRTDTRSGLVVMVDDSGLQDGGNLVQADISGARHALSVHKKRTATSLVPRGSSYSVLTIEGNGVLRGSGVLRVMHADESG
jgi:hypothetical protein